MRPWVWWDTKVSGSAAPSLFYLSGQSLVDSLWGAEQAQVGRVKERGQRRMLGVISRSVGPELGFARHSLGSI